MARKPSRSINSALTGSAMASPQQATLFGVPLKVVSLVTLTVQNSALTILLHYSRTSTTPDKTYSAPAAVLLNELLKGSISFAIALRNSFNAGPLVDGGGAGPRIEGRRRGTLEGAYFSHEDQSWEGKLRLFAREAIPRCKILKDEILSPDCWKLSIPAILYVIQNNLQFVAASNLDPATFQVSYQMKIMTTALFSVLLLNKRLSPSKWLSLFGLALGVAIVQLQSSSATGGGSSTAHASGHVMNAFTGFSAVTAACLTSGLAGVYFEKVLKGSTADLWVRNIQLSLFSILPALIPAFFPDLSLFSSHPAPIRTEPRPWLFANFGFWAWATVLTQVLGGLVTALVIKYSDNILKGFATSLSIVLSFLAGVVLFGFSITWPFTIGCSIVLAATWSYNRTSPAPGIVGVGGGNKELNSVVTHMQENGHQRSPIPNQYPLHAPGQLGNGVQNGKSENAQFPPLGGPLLINGNGFNTGSGLTGKA